MSEIMCTHCRKKGEKMLCNKCYSDLACKSSWNELASKNEIFSEQYLEIINTLNELIISINKLEFQLKLKQ